MTGTSTTEAPASPVAVPAALEDVLGAGSVLPGLLAEHGLRFADEVRLGRFDAIAAARRPQQDVLPLFLTGSALLVAPPPDTAAAGEPAPCAGCLALRWQKLRSLQERDVLERDSRFEQIADNPLHASAMARRAAEHLVADAVRGGGDRSDPHRLPHVVQLALDTGLVQRYPLVPDPQCACARRPQDSAGLATVTLSSRPKPSPAALRCQDVESYRIPFEAFANPVCGVIGDGMVPDTISTTTAPVTGYMLTRGSWMLHDFYWSGHADAYEQSGALAVLEGLERYAGLKRLRQTGLTRASRAQLGREHTLDPRECGVYPDDFYEDNPFFVPYTDDLVMNWVWAYSLRDSRPVQVPERLVFYLDEDRDSNFVQECSNGCATGSNLEESILYGLLELIERDAFLIGWYGKVALPEIDPASVPSASVQHMLARMRSIGYDVRLFDNRMDIDVPVVTAVAVNRDPEALGQVTLAAGASLDPVDAIRAALCEIASYAPSFPDRVAAVVDRLRPMAEDYDRVKELPHHALLFGLPEMQPHLEHLLGPSRARPMADVFAGWEDRRPRTGDLLDDLTYCTDQVHRAGHDVVVVEQTSPEQQLLGVRTTCVIAPGLVPIDFGWDKQRAPYLPRLGEALNRAGYRDGPVTPDSLHLVPHPFP